MRNEKNNDRIIGKHVYGNLYGIDQKIAGNEKALRALVKKAVKAANARLHSIHSWKFKGKKSGISVIALVLESHVSIHTWLKYDYATIDIYTCGEHTDPWKAFEVIKKVLKPKYYTVNYADRSKLFS